jgi:YesN/AraC family two-component response regulator
MPEMDGFQFAMLFHELPARGSVPLIALSGYSSQAYRESALEVGIHYYLLKPANPKYLKDLLAREIRTTAALPSLGRDTIHRLAVEFPKPRRQILRGVAPQLCLIPEMKRYAGK